ncbi:hypothetical protein FUA48_07925 [Flavobacterium alkalisoli]|uniref:SGNH hydrolase-type esterase domain-containing protein n=1 Tax=Flavobacterium alkalisoli TaxID=2602769 RepID=A0A5B9FYM6_9FLAO|nr:hypothetical protein FUA48_07925 [Flavobacterium alkalisoli]
MSIAAFIGFKQVLPKKIFTESTTVNKNVVVDSLLLEAIEATDTIAVETDTITEEDIVFEEKHGVQFPTETFEQYKGYQHLVPLFQKLFELETTGEGKVRIAYFGDSMTDGDMIVQDFRSNLQEKFGGEGVGFVNITSESAASRSSVVHQFSGNWKTQSYLNVKNPIRPFGVNGHVFFVKHDTVNPVWIKYKAGGLKHMSKLNSPTLFYGQSGNEEASVAVINGKDTIVKKLNPTKRLNTLLLSSGDLKTLKADFIKADSIPFYGVNFDNGRGVHVDNFSNRGNSGLPISMFNTNLMRAFNDKLGYDLIVLHYGTNVLNYGSYNYKWYERGMTRVINHLKECFPGVAILVISTADKSTKYDLEMKTDSAVVPLAQAQKRFSIQSEAAYVNLYTLMGGDGSMVKWVEEVPAMANKDYTHFNYKGAKKVADLIYTQVINGYEQYKKLRAKSKPVEINDPEEPETENDSVILYKDSLHD